MKNSSWIFRNDRAHLFFFLAKDPDFHIFPVKTREIHILVIKSGVNFFQVKDLDFNI